MGNPGPSQIHDDPSGTLRNLIQFGLYVKAKGGVNRSAISALSDFGDSLLKEMSRDDRAALLLWLIDRYRDDTSDWICAWSKRVLAEDLTLTESQTSLVRDWFHPRFDPEYRTNALIPTIKKILARNDPAAKTPAVPSRENSRAFEAFDRSRLAMVVGSRYHYMHKDSDFLKEARPRTPVEASPPAETIERQHCAFDSRSSALSKPRLS